MPTAPSAGRYQNSTEGSECQGVCANRPRFPALGKPQILKPRMKDRQELGQCLRGSTSAPWRTLELNGHVGDGYFCFGVAK